MSDTIRDILLKFYESHRYSVCPFYFYPYSGTQCRELCGKIWPETIKYYEYSGGIERIVGTECPCAHFGKEIAIIKLKEYLDNGNI